MENNHQKLRDNLNPPMPQDEMRRKGREALQADVLADTNNF